jgi:hypothetical protein
VTEPNSSTENAPQTDPTVDALPAIPPPGQAADRDTEIAQLRSEAARWRKTLRERETEIEKLKLAGASETERAIAAAKAEGAAEYTKRWRKAVVDNAALTVLAERGVTATEPALRSLDLDDIEVDPESGQFDRNAVNARVDDLLSKYPMFAGSRGSPLPIATGDNQHRVTTDQLIRRSAKPTDAETEALLRYGLGR